MKKYAFYYKMFGFLFLAATMTSVVLAKGSKDLMNRRKKLIKEIQEIQALLKETKDDKTATLSQYKALKTQVEKQEELMTTIKTEIENIEQNVTNSQDTIALLKEDLKRYKADYGNMMRHAYRHKNTNKRALFVLSAQNFNDAMRRWQYFVRYDQQRKRQIVLVNETQEYLNKKIIGLTAKREEQTALLAENENQQKELTAALAEKDSLLKKLKEKENEIAANLAAKNEAKAQLTDAIDKAIRADQKENRAGARTQKASVTKPLTSSDKKLTAAFYKAKGKLPKPVKGAIVGKYGTQPHPTLARVTIKNNGIDIRAKVGSSVNSIFEGEVVNVFTIPGADETSVMVRHGSYYVVYSNLENVVVKKGQKIKAQDNIGKIGNSANAKQSELHFEIWNNNKTLNPVVWLQR